MFAAETEDSVFQWLRQDIDKTVAQRSRQMLFVHAGVVGWRGLAIVIPGRSHSGKSTLVAELVRRGAVYYSDEFAVLDDTGRVHPYRRPPVLRDQARKPQDLRLLREDEPTEPLPIGLIVAGAYKPGTTWRPTIVRGAQAVLPLIDGTVLARQESARMLRIAARVASAVVTLRGLRPEATDVAAQLLDLVDDALVSRAINVDGKDSSPLARSESRRRAAAAVADPAGANGSPIARRPLPADDGFPLRRRTPALTRACARLSGLTSMPPGLSVAQVRTRWTTNFAGRALFPAHGSRALGFVRPAAACDSAGREERAGNALVSPWRRRAAAHGAWERRFLCAAHRHRSPGRRQPAHFMCLLL